MAKNKRPRRSYKYLKRQSGRTVSPFALPNVNFNIQDAFSGGQIDTGIVPPPITNNQVYVDYAGADTLPFESRTTPTTTVPVSREAPTNFSTGIEESTGLSDINSILEFFKNNNQIQNLFSSAGLGDISGANGIQDIFKLLMEGPGNVGPVNNVLTNSQGFLGFS